jgi:hypothetical protein
VTQRHGLAAGALTRATTDSDFDVPTNGRQARQRLYAVNARLGTTPGPDTPYAVVQARR